MKKTEFSIPKMDCPSEERLIRMSLAELKNIKNLEFDMPNRKMFALYDGHEIEILKKLEPLNFGIY